MGGAGPGQPAFLWSLATTQLTIIALFLLLARYDQSASPLGHKVQSALQYMRP